MKYNQNKLSLSNRTNHPCTVGLKTAEVFSNPVHRRTLCQRDHNPVDPLLGRAGRFFHQKQQALDYELISHSIIIKKGALQNPEKQSAG